MLAERSDPFGDADSWSAWRWNTTWPALEPSAPRGGRTELHGRAAETLAGRFPPAAGHNLPRALASAFAVEAITLSSCGVLLRLRLVNTDKTIGAFDRGVQTMARSLAVP